jgi:hypothetical protein
LAPLFAQDGTEKNRRWSFANVLERLKAIRCHGSEQKGPPRVEMGPFWGFKIPHLDV